MDSEDIVSIVAVISIFVLCPIAIALARLLWRKASGSAVDAGANASLVSETARRLADMQTSLDALTLEIERIAENQRFVTKVMTERPPAGLPAGLPAGAPSKTAGKKNS